MEEDKTDENFITTEKSGIDVFLRDLKKSTFSVLYVLLKEEDSGLIRLFIENITDYLQMLQFIFHDKIKRIWKADNVLNTIFDVFNFFAIAKYFSGTFTWTLYLIIFYTCIGAIILAVLDIIYVSYSFNKKRFSVMWPLIVLRNVVTLSVTVLFLPITEFLIQMVQCEYDAEKGYSVHSMFSEIQCWNGMHILHSVVALINIIVFVSISMVVALNYFESRISSDDPTARSNSRADVVFIVNKILLQTTFAFVPKEWDWPLVIIIFVAGFWLWYLYQFDDPYYNEVVSKMFKALSGYYMWTCFMLFIAKVLENTSFKGGLISWLLGKLLLLFPFAYLPFANILLISCRGKFSFR
jgi:hypothetical protein